MYTIADMITDLPDDKMIFLDHQLFYHIAEVKDGDLAFDYLCNKLFTRIQNLVVLGGTELGKELALQYYAIPACDDDIQRVFRNVREADERALQILQQRMAAGDEVDDESADTDTDTDWDSELDYIVTHDSPTPAPAPAEPAELVALAKPAKPDEPAVLAKPDERVALPKPDEPVTLAKAAKPTEPVALAKAAKPTEPVALAKAAKPVKPAPAKPAKKTKTYKIPQFVEETPEPAEPAEPAVAELTPIVYAPPPAEAVVEPAQKKPRNKSVGSIMESVAK